MDPDFTGFDVSLRDGRTVRIRPMCPSDEVELLQAFARLSPEARYMRFIRSVREPNLDRLRQTLASVPERGTGIVATLPDADGIDIVGSAIVLFESDPVACEFAISVAGDCGGAGLGRALMTTLIDVARRRGLQVMEGFVLTGNTPMLRLSARLGFSITPDPDSPAMRICRLHLGGQQDSGTESPESFP